MRLGLILLAAFVGIALLVGLVAFLYGGTSSKVQHQVEDLRQSSIEQVRAATGMRLALQASQLAAQELLAGRYRDQVEASHESEWGVAADIDRESIRDSLQDFEKEVERSWGASRAAQSIARRWGDAATAEEEFVRLSARIREIEAGYQVYAERIERFVHLGRYHPSDQVQEYFDDVLEPHYRGTMVPSIRQFEEEAKAGLADAAARIETALMVGNRRNLAIAAAALAAAILLGLLIARSISVPLASLREAALRIGKGDLDTPVEVDTGNEIGVLSEAFQQMVDDLKETTVSRAYLDKILQSMKELLVVTDADDRIRRVNRLMLDELGYDEQELYGRPFDEIAEAGGEPAVEAAGEIEEMTLLAVDGRRVPVTVSSAVLEDEAGRLEGVVRVAQNVTDRRRVEGELRQSLAEKEALLKEVHHRVKNNLQIISSLLNLQEGHQEDPLTERRFRESQNRIRSMALIHELLYRSEDLTRIDFAEYLDQLVHHVVRSYGPAGQAVRPELSIEPEAMSLDFAIPCGLIVTELVANAIEHAFPGRPGSVAVSFRIENGRHRLSVADDGVGLPPEIDPETSDSLGLRLVAALARQLGGELELAVEGGTEFTITYDPRGAAG
ncbi:MAG: sensor histidine kinase [Thermoanaerobaculia bacterium]